MARGREYQIVGAATAKLQEPVDVGLRLLTVCFSCSVQRQRENAVIV